MLKFLSLSSGSNANCYYIGNNDLGLLIDDGLSGRTIKKRLAECGIDMESIQMILVTHEHIDHIRHLGALADKLSVPVFTTAKVHKALETHPLTAGYISGCKRVIKEMTPSEHRGVKFLAFTVPHDASETVGYFIDFSGHKFVFMTDLGDVPDHALEYARQADYVILESNYDKEMLLDGPYTMELKMRILQGNGHLSNEQCGNALQKIYNGNQKAIFLCHLSENNNSPEKAYNSARFALSSIGVEVGRDVRLYCLPRKESSPVFSIPS